MGVYFRTGRHSGASVPWWFYLLIVLPMQLLYWMVVAAVYIAAAAFAAIVWAIDKGLERQRRRRPAP